jgi:hypothetical protein
MNAEGGFREAERASGVSSNFCLKRGEQAGLHAVRLTGSTGLRKTIDGRFRRFLLKTLIKSEF